MAVVRYVVVAIVFAVFVLPQLKALVALLLTLAPAPGQQLLYSRMVLIMRQGFFLIKL